MGLYAAISQFCGDGSTPTGLSTFDLNSPEDDWSDYGPYPVNRVVQGLKGTQVRVVIELNR